MRTLNNYLIMPVLALLCACGSARADMANGTYTNGNDGTLLPIWDISGSYTGALDEISVTFNLSESNSGQFLGQGTFSYNGTFLTVNGTNSIVGEVSGSTLKPTVSLDMLIGGSATFLGDDYSFLATARVQFTLNATNAELTVTKGSVSEAITDVTSGSKYSNAESVSKTNTFALPSNVTGGWNVTLNLTPDVTKYTGTATLTSSTGGTAEFTASGNYSPKADRSKIKLKGASGELSLEISTSGSSMTIQSMKGKVFGQKVNYKAK